MSVSLSFSFSNGTFLKLPTSEAEGFLPTNQGSKGTFKYPPTHSNSSKLRLRIVSESFGCLSLNAPYPAIICPLTIPNLVGSVPCWDCDLLGYFHALLYYWYSLFASVDYTRRLKPLPTYPHVLSPGHGRLVFRFGYSRAARLWCDRNLSNSDFLYLKPRVFGRRGYLNRPSAVGSC